MMGIFGFIHYLSYVFHSKQHILVLKLFKIQMVAEEDIQHLKFRIQDKLWMLYHEGTNLIRDFLN